MIKNSIRSIISLLMIFVLSANIYAEEIIFDSFENAPIDYTAETENTGAAKNASEINYKETASDNIVPERQYVTSLNGVPIIVAKQKVDISSEFSSVGPIKKYVVEPRGYAKVSKKGILVGKKPGKITINAVDTSGNIVKTIERVVYQPRLSPMTATKIGEIIYAEDYLKGDSDYLYKPTRWSISKSLATIDYQTGKIVVGQEGKHGKAAVTVYYGEGKNAAKYKATLNVKLPYLSVTKLTMKAGTSKKIKLYNAPAGVPVYWDSSKEKVATVNDDGKIKAKREGKCEITARAGEYEYTCKLTVKDDD